MTIGAVIAEFNPFHNGHAALIAAMRSQGADYILAVMSGSFVQRGEPAIADKFTRAQCAMAGGVDMVLELPLPFATATAQRFALGSVSLLQGTGFVDLLAFGSEAGDLETLIHLAQVVDMSDTTKAMSAFLEKGLTFAKARQLAVAQQYGDHLAQHLASPNNALAVEYIRQAHSIGWQPNFFTLPRQGAGHDAPLPQDGIASASWLRRHADDFSALTPYVPEAVLGILLEASHSGLYPANLHALDTPILSHLRRMSKEDIARLPDLSEGLENRLYTAIGEAVSLEDLHMRLKTKRYTLARVRRLVLAAYLGIERSFQELPPPYLRILGCKKESRQLLSMLQKSSQIPVSSSLSWLEIQGSRAKRGVQLESLAGDLYALILPTPPSRGYEYRAKIL